MAAAQVRLVEIRDSALSLDEVVTAVSDGAAGGVASFVGTVRNHDHDKRVGRLSYSAHPNAEARMREVAEGVARGHPVIALAAVHRVGELRVGDAAVVVAVSSAHRQEAIAACRQLIDDLKATVPIWKHQEFVDGTDEWVGTP